MIGEAVFLGKYLVPVLVPFIIAFIVAGILNKPINYISKKLKIKRKITSIICVLLFVFCSSIAVSYFCSFIFGVIENVFSFLPGVFDGFVIPMIEEAFERIENLFHKVDLSLLDVLQTNASVVLESMNQAVSHFSNGILTNILPVLGTGTVLIPWSIIHIMTGNYSMAAGIFILYLVITVIRNIVEPKLIGKQMELHPVITLASMLTGLKFFGIWGLFGLPIGISFLKKLNSNGIIHIFKSIPE